MAEVKLNQDSIDRTQLSQEVDDQVLQRGLLSSPEMNLVDLNQQFDCFTGCVGGTRCEQEISQTQYRPFKSHRLIPFIHNMKYASSKDTPPGEEHIP